MSFLDRIRDCNRADPDEFRPLLLEGAIIGYVRPAFAQALVRTSPLFAAAEGALAMSGPADPDGRSEALDPVMRALRDEGLIGGWREERLTVQAADGRRLFDLERAAAKPLGVVTGGVHVSGYVQTAEGPALWVARRSPGKETWPGMLDSFVAGGIRAGAGVRDTLVAECAEEAGVAEELARSARPVGFISCAMTGEDGLHRNVEHCFDLELPADFVPRNHDGEVAGHELLPAAEVMRLVAGTRELKYNVNLVFIDFFVRHGLLAPEHPDYLAVVAGLRPNVYAWPNGEWSLP